MTQYEMIEQLKARIDQLEARVKELEANNPERSMPMDCQKHTCSYFVHYLAYGPAELTHEGFHAAEKICERVQLRAQAWLDDENNAGKPFPESLDKMCRAAEARVRA